MITTNDNFIQIVKQYKHNPENYTEFLKYLGIDPKDFDEEYDIDMDDYSR